MSKTVIVKIEQELSNYIEGLQVEVNARENIVKSILTTPGCEINKALFDEYHKEYTDFKAEYEKAKEQVQLQYMPTEFQGHNVTWSLDFTTCEVTFEKTCDC